MTCATCHDPGQHKSGGVQRAALRLQAPELCRVCHDETTTMNRVEHGIAIGRAHLLSNRVRLSAYGVDDITRECMGCHDGSVAPERATAIVSGQRGSHPVGRVYSETQLSGRKGQLRPKRMLPEDVQLAQDTVGCQSCHSPFSRDEAMLNAPMRNSQLCLSCHDM